MRLAASLLSTHGGAAATAVPLGRAALGTPLLGWGGHRGLLIPGDAAPAEPTWSQGTPQRFHLQVQGLCTASGRDARSWDLLLTPAGRRPSSSASRRWLRRHAPFADRLAGAVLALLAAGATHAAARPDMAMREFRRAELGQLSPELRTEAERGATQGNTPRGVLATIPPNSISSR